MSGRGLLAGARGAWGPSTQAGHLRHLARRRIRSGRRQLAQQELRGVVGERRAGRAVEVEDGVGAVPTQLGDVVVVARHRGDPAREARRLQPGKRDEVRLVERHREHRDAHAAGTLDAVPELQVGGALRRRRRRVPAGRAAVARTGSDAALGVADALPAWMDPKRLERPPEDLVRSSARARTAAMSARVPGDPKAERSAALERTPLARSLHDARVMAVMSRWIDWPRALLAEGPAAPYLVVEERLTELRRLSMAADATWTTVDVANASAAIERRRSSVNLSSTTR